MNDSVRVQTGTLERLCPIAGSTGEWLAVIDGKSFLTWPDALSASHDASRCGSFGRGRRVRFETDQRPTSIPVGRRAGRPDAPAMVRLLSVEN